MEQRDFFISYTEKDEAWALWVAETLSRHQKTVYIQAWDSPAGQDFRKWMMKAINFSYNFIFLWSKAYSTSKHGRQELNHADRLHGSDNSKGENTINLFIPLRVEDFPMDEVYGGITYIDLFRLDEATAEQELCHVTGCSAHKRRLGLFPQTMRSDRDKFYMLGQIYAEDETPFPIEARNGFAIDCLKRATDMGHASACLLLGHLYEQDRRFVKAEKWYKEAVKRGIRQANLDLGRLYRTADIEMLPSRYEMALKHYEEANASKDPEYLCAYGFFYETGYAGFEKNDNLACQYYQDAADSGNREAIIKLSEFYQYGKCGLPKNVYEACNLLRDIHADKPIEKIEEDFKEAQEAYPLEPVRVRKRVIREIRPDGFYVNLPGIYFDGFLKKDNDKSYAVDDEISVKVVDYDEKRFLMVLEAVP